MQPYIGIYFVRFETQRYDGIRIVHIQLHLFVAAERDLVQINIVGRILIGPVFYAVDRRRIDAVAFDRGHLSRSPRSDPVFVFGISRSVYARLGYLMVISPQYIRVRSRSAVRTERRRIYLEAPGVVHRMLNASEYRTVRLRVGARIIIVILEREQFALHDLAVLAQSDGYELGIYVFAARRDGSVDRVPFGMKLQQFQRLRDQIFVFTLEFGVGRSRGGSSTVIPVVAVICGIVLDAVHEVDVPQRVGFGHADHLTAYAVIVPVYVVIDRTAVGKSTVGVHCGIFDVSVPVADDAVDVSVVVGSPLRRDRVEHIVRRIESRDDAADTEREFLVPVDTRRGVERRPSPYVAFSREDHVVYLAPAEHPSDQTAGIRYDRTSSSKPVERRELVGRGDDGFRLYIESTVAYEPRISSVGEHHARISARRDDGVYLSFAVVTELVCPSAVGTGFPRHGKLHSLVQSQRAIFYRARVDRGDYASGYQRSVAGIAYGNAVLQDEIYTADSAEIASHQQTACARADSRIGLGHGVEIGIEEMRAVGLVFPAADVTAHRFAFLQYAYRRVLVVHVAAVAPHLIRSYCPRRGQGHRVSVAEQRFARRHRHRGSSVIDGYVAREDSVIGVGEFGISGVGRRKSEHIRGHVSRSRRRLGNAVLASGDEGHKLRLIIYEHFVEHESYDIYAVGGSHTAGGRETRKSVGDVHRRGCGDRIPAAERMISRDPGYAVLARLSVAVEICGESLVILRGRDVVHGYAQIARGLPRCGDRVVGLSRIAVVGHPEAHTHLRPRRVIAVYGLRSVSEHREIVPFVERRGYVVHVFAARPRYVAVIIDFPHDVSDRVGVDGDCVGSHSVEQSARHYADLGARKRAQISLEVHVNAVYHGRIDASVSRGGGGSIDGVVRTQSYRSARIQVERSACRSAVGRHAVVHISDTLDHARADGRAVDHACQSAERGGAAAQRAVDKDTGQILRLEPCPRHNAAKVAYDTAERRKIVTDVYIYKPVRLHLDGEPVDGRVVVLVGHHTYQSAYGYAVYHAAAGDGYARLRLEHDLSHVLYHGAFAQLSADHAADYRVAVTAVRGEPCDLIVGHRRESAYNASVDAYQHSENDAVVRGERRAVRSDLLRGGISVFREPDHVAVIHDERVPGARANRDGKFEQRAFVAGKEHSLCRIKSRIDDLGSAALGLLPPYHDLGRDIFVHIRRDGHGVASAFVAVQRLALAQHKTNLRAGRHRDVLIGRRSVHRYQLSFLRARVPTVISVSAVCPAAPSVDPSYVVRARDHRIGMPREEGQKHIFVSRIVGIYPHVRTDREFRRGAVPSRDRDLRRPLIRSRGAKLRRRGEIGKHIRHGQRKRRPGDRNAERRVIRYRSRSIRYSVTRGRSQRGRVAVAEHGRRSDGVDSKSRVVEHVPERILDGNPVLGTARKISVIASVVVVNAAAQRRDRSAHGGRSVQRACGAAYTGAARADVRQSSEPARGHSRQRTSRSRARYASDVEIPRDASAVLDDGDVRVRSQSRIG